MDIQLTSSSSILFIDEQPICGYGLKRILSSNQNFHVEGMVDHLSDLRSHYRPDIIALEISVAKSKGIAAIKDLRRQFPSTNVLVFTGHDELLFAERCLKAGARGYLMKSAPESEIVKAFKSVASGNLYISERLRSRILNRISGNSSEEEMHNCIDQLSDRELLIVQHIGQSKNNQEIASELQISIKTIESHRSRIKSKLQLSSPNELVRYAMRLHNSTI
ncbi:response regulator transcription factor [Puniceicoccaceae bacterium K14]|nr:response regulator transcription factor [Puniceicoccaceae bacterium K14]